MFLLISNSPSAVVNFRLDLIKALQLKGQIVSVACPGMTALSPERLLLEREGVVVYEIPMNRSGLNPFVDLVTFFTLWNLMRKVQFDRVLSYTIKPVVWGSLAAFFARVPLRYALITGLGYAFVEGDSLSKKRALVKRVACFLYRLALNRCERVFFQNPDDESLFRELGILNSDTHSTVVKGSGVNLESFKPSPLPEKTAFILISRLLIDKGVREYALAAERLKRNYPDVSFILAGYLDENPESIKQAELDRWTQDGYIIYLGKLSDVRPAIRQSSVFVLPSFYREGIPRTILEALAMGRAVITSDAPGCREAVKDGVNGYLVKPKSVNQLVVAMEKLINHPEQIKQMAEISVQFAKDYFDVHKVNSVMLRDMQL